MLRAVALGLGLATAQRFDQPAPFDPLDGALEWIKQHGHWAWNGRVWDWGKLMMVVGVAFFS